MRRVEELQKLISNAKVLEIDSNVDFELYKQERMRLLNYVAEYYYMVEKDVDDVSDYIVETTDECIKYYTKDQGDFLHYLRRSIARKIHTVRAKEYQKERDCGMRNELSEKNRLLIKNFKKYINNKGGIITNELIQAYAELTNIDYDLIFKVIDMDKKQSNIRVDSIIYDSEGEEVSIFNVKQQEGGNPNEYQDHDERDAIFGAIKDAYESLQNRKETNDIIGAWLTMLIIKEYNTKILNMLLKEGMLPYFKNEVYIFFKNEHKELTLSDIARVYGKSIESVSRTINNFYKKIKL